MLPELFLDMFTPVSDIHNYDTRQAINKNFVCFLQIYYIYWTPCLEFYLVQNQSPLLHRIIQKTLSFIITALLCVRFDVVITDIITTKTFSLPWPPCVYMCVCVCVNIDPYVYIYIYIYAYVYALFLFYLIDFIIFVRDEHEALNCILANSIVPKCSTVTCFLAPCFDNYLLWNSD